MTTLAGGSSGAVDGTGTVATFNNPKYCAVSSDGTIFLSEDNHLIRKITAAGSIQSNRCVVVLLRLLVQLWLL